MADALLDNDCDSAFGDDRFFWLDPMFPPPTAPLAGTKRDADRVRDDAAQCTAPGPAADGEHQAGHIDAQVPRCRTCPDRPCCDAVSDARPSKRRASVLKVGEFHGPAAAAAADDDSTLSWDLDQQFPDTCFAQFCQDCDLDASCDSPCALPCPGDGQCSPDDACFEAHCETTCGERECSDQCVDPECTNKSPCATEPCYSPKCAAEPCPLGDPASDCHSAHTAPTTEGAIYCYSNGPCHFQDGYHGYDPNLGSYETYPCFSQSHAALGQGNVTHTSSATTPVLSPGAYTSLESAFSNQSSPTPGGTSAPECFLNIPFDHCHFDNSCCHGSSRTCGDVPNAPQNQLDMWTSSLAQGNGLANSFMHFGLSQPGAAFLNPTSFHNPMLGFNDPSWMLPASQYPNAFQNGTHTRLELLTSALQEGLPRPITSQSATSSIDVGEGYDIRPTTSTSADESQAYICKWQHGPSLLCLTVFDGPEDLHKHIKTAHVDNCTRCFCQWEGCEVCTKDFKQRSKLSRHLLGHAGYRPFSCSFKGCTRTFATNQAKDNHERTHTGDRPYVCSRCGYTTTTHTQLQTHISALHEGRKPHKCRFCDFTCADSSNLSKHERTHQTLRPYRCPHPGCTFKPDCRWDNLKRHLRRSGHCRQLLTEGSEECRTYRENVRREIDEWHKRNEDGGATVVGKMTRRKGRC
ncbi:hypothetical protein BDV95DRAFT_497193 [Massariosphaeria phaeospora]|uniref:C2H2 type master regulator of conidiophore development brlA n=1 Tax=Massariosphaeria phaeospora TaxID=100035 RepID=A0A7C8I5F7_9PLEO|nr:hypothetical protein BDV95DRAFT_497193 [Massariosphaeria phaeospora]